MKQLLYWFVGELLQELSQLIQRKLLYPVNLSVSRCSSTTLSGLAVVVHAAVSVPHVIRNVDTPHIVFDNPVFCWWNGTNQNKRLGTLLPKKVGHLRLVDPPRVLVELGVLRNHVCQGESGVAAWDCKRRATRSLLTLKPNIPQLKPTNVM